MSKSVKYDLCLGHSGSVPSTTMMMMEERGERSIIFLNSFYVVPGQFRPPILKVMIVIVLATAKTDREASSAMRSNKRSDNLISLSTALLILTVFLYRGAGYRHDYRPIRAGIRAGNHQSHGQQ